MSEILISQPEWLEETIQKITESGSEVFCVLADFDRTLTKYKVNGEEVPSIISVLRDEGYLTPDYPEKAKALYAHYSQIEDDPNTPIDERKVAMHEWWSKHFDLLIKSKLHKDDVAKAITSQRLQLREGTADLIKHLKEKNVPLVILSSGGLGIEAISLYLERQGLLYDNVHIISNEFEWDDEGYAVAVKQPIIHSKNKDQSSLNKFPFYNKIKDRKNVLLLGDSADDPEMITGFDYDNLIKIGFLNKDIEEKKEAYQKKYDIVITDDSDMSYINDLTKKLIN